MTIPQPVLNTFNRVGINPDHFSNDDDKITAYNRFGGGSCETTRFIAYLIEWVYRTNNDYDLGRPSKVSIADFDRVRDFVLKEDSNAYYVCLD